MRPFKKKSLLDQASDYVDSVRPQVESAVAHARDAVEDFVETTARPMLHDAYEKAGPALADARDKAGPALADARDKAGPLLADARDKAAPLLADARDKAAPLVADARGAAAERASVARDLADAKVAQLKGEPAPKKKRGKLKKIALFAIIAGAVGFVAKKLQGGGEADSWQSSYVPSPPPAATSAEDTGGSSPDEALADEAETAQPVSTPDEPADVIAIDKDAEDGPAKD